MNETSLGRRGAILSLAPLLPVHVSGLRGGLHPKCNARKANFDPVLRIGHLGLRAQVEVLSALRTDTPVRVGAKHPTCSGRRFLASLQE